jgi:hypothetical protein
MNHKTIMWLVGLGGAYLFLTMRQPVFVKLTDGTYQPVGILDKLTVALTGAQPPPPQTATLNIPGIIQASFTN